MTCSEFDFVCQLQTAILAFIANHWMAIVLGFVGLLLLVFAPLKWKLLGAAILILLAFVIAALFGIVGYWLTKHDFEAAPMLLAYAADWDAAGSKILAAFGVTPAAIRDLVNKFNQPG